MKETIAKKIKEEIYLGTNVGTSETLDEENQIEVIELLIEKKMKIEGTNDIIYRNETDAIAIIDSILNKIKQKIQIKIIVNKQIKLQENTYTIKLLTMKKLLGDDNNGRKKL